MYRTVDGIAGRKCPVNYDAPPHPLSAGLGWWQKSTAIAAFLKENEAKAALVVKDGENETWLAAEGPGYSLLAAVEAWAVADPERAEDREDAVVVIPLDERIYVAELEGGLVEREGVSLPARALETVRKALDAGALVVAFEGGEQTAAVSELVKPEPLDLDPFGFRFRGVMPVVVAAGLFHRIYLALPATATALAAGVALDLGGVDDSGIQRSGPVVAYERQHPFTARPQLEELGAMLGAGFAEALYSAGWARLDAEGAAVTARGSAKGYPAAVEALAEQRGATFRLSPDGWEMSLPLAELAQEQRVDGFGHDALVRRVFEAGQRVGGQVSLVSNVDGLSTRQAQIAVQIERASEAHLRALGASLDGLPVMVLNAYCELGNWIAGSCTIVLLAKGDIGA